MSLSAEGIPALLLYPGVWVVVGVQPVLGLLNTLTDHSHQVSTLRTRIIGSAPRESGAEQESIHNRKSTKADLLLWRPCSLPALGSKQRKQLRQERTGAREKASAKRQRHTHRDGERGGRIEIEQAIGQKGGLEETRQTWQTRGRVFGCHLPGESTLAQQGQHWARADNYKTHTQVQGRQSVAKVLILKSDSHFSQCWP